MQDFIEKWKTDSRFKTKVKLGLYTLFVVIVSIYAFSSRTTLPTNTLETENTTDNATIEIPDKYSYEINIDINEKNYKYNGTKDYEVEAIQKTAEEMTYNYIYKDNKYYKDAIGITNIINKEEVYDIVDYNYLNLENINEYLSLSTEEDGKNIIYLNDIIAGNDSEDYITITLDENKINIDYTSLMKVFDKTIENFDVEVIIEEIE